MCVCLFSSMDLCGLTQIKNEWKKWMNEWQVRQQDTNSSYGVHSPWGYWFRLHFYKTLVKLMLSCNWHVTLPDIRRLEVQNVWDALGVPYCRQRRENMCETDIYHHLNFHADQREISVRGQIYIFSLWDSSGGYRRLRPMLYMFKAAIELILSSY